MDKENNLSLLNMIEHPAFCVCDGMIIQVNPPAEQMMIMIGMPVADILKNDAQAYQEFQNGCLYLTVTTAGITCDASVTRMNGFDLFLMQGKKENERLMELIAQQLRIPLNDAFLAADQLMLAEDPNIQGSVGGLQKGLNQIHRIVSNMADIGQYRAGNSARLEPTNLTALFDEIMERLQSLVIKSGNQLNYAGLAHPVIGLADRDMLERAVSNLFSNAIKFSPKGSTLTATLTMCGDLIKFSLLDQGDRENTSDYRNLFTRYMRPPSIEDGRRGIGLGLPLVAAVATMHGGTTLVDYPGERGTRVTITIKQCGASGTAVHSPILLPRRDYAGGRDRGLMELSDVLPASEYQPRSKKD